MLGGRHPLAVILRHWRHLLGSVARQAALARVQQARFDLFAVDAVEWVQARPARVKYIICKEKADYFTCLKLTVNVSVITELNVFLFYGEKCMEKVGCVLDI